VCAAYKWGDRLGSKVYKGRGVSLGLCQGARCLVNTLLARGVLSLQENSSLFVHKGSRPIESTIESLTIEREIVGLLLRTR
jgi:hypothetical protein